MNQSIYDLPPGEYPDLQNIWAERAKIYGKRSVLNLAFSDAMYDEVTLK